MTLQEKLKLISAASNEIIRLHNSIGVCLTNLEHTTWGEEAKNRLRSDIEGYLNNLRNLPNNHEVISIAFVQKYLNSYSDTGRKIAAML